MKEYHQKTKVGLILCSCFFAFGTYWSDWAFDYYLLWANPADHPNAVSRAAIYYATQSEVPNILKYIPLANLLVGALGFSAGLANMTDGNILFDGASVVLLLFGLSTYTTSVKPALVTVTESKDELEVLAALKNIAAAHFIIVLAITGIVGLQLAHLFAIRKTDKAEAAEEVESEKKESTSKKDD
ncbi:ER membrane protein SH3 [Cunninghamella echinulata]|nr:ER membrane protein SH3 [Cunninghamella echinulata]